VCGRWKYDCLDEEPVMQLMPYQVVQPASLGAYM
jgi:hypothetical protein